MPAYKVPCPHCGNFIMRDVAACPFCRTPDPFAPLRCANCRAVLEDARWSVCPSCGTPVARSGTANPGA
jgi:RNA polymerase subunit RPABC4/transcription elongation factor Spt4